MSSKGFMFAISASIVSFYCYAMEHERSWDYGCRDQVQSLEGFPKKQQPLKVETWFDPTG